MRLYEINDQCNRWEDLSNDHLIKLGRIFKSNYPNYRIEVKSHGVFVVSSPSTPTVRWLLDISIVYTSFVSDPVIPDSLRNESLKFLLSALGPPKGK